MAADLAGLFIFGALSLLVLWFARKNGFFHLEEQKDHWSPPIRWYQVVFAFAVYFGVAIFLVPLFSKFLRSSVFPGNAPVDFLGYASWLNFITSSAILLGLALFFFRLPHTIYGKILKKGDALEPKKDLQTALLAWLFSFPIVLFVNQLLEIVITHIVHVERLPEQIAVHFLKMTFDYPVFFSLAILTIILFAPLIEELLFRGFLQSFIRQHLGSKQAILITALCFSFFHYSPEQGLGNIPIIGSLFVLALFLGFVYEKRGSLLAPVALHATFNAISVINLYFFGDFPKGPL